MKQKTIEQIKTYGAMVWLAVFVTSVLWGTWYTWPMMVYIVVSISAVIATVLALSHLAEVKGW